MTCNVQMAIFMPAVPSRVYLRGETVDAVASFVGIVEVLSASMFSEIELIQ